jgi:Kdo2-lipid IVA lauroyltransferase/acyltransferase
LNERHGPDRRGTDRHTAGKTWRTWLEAAPLCLLWGVARRLPRRFAAHLAGALFATVGPLTRKQRHVKRNLSFVKPDASPAELERLARAVWRNLGAVLAEFPHLERIVDEAITVEFAPQTAALLETGQPIVILTAHLGNWEVLGAWLARHGPPLTAIYDRNDNPIIERRIQTYRRADRIRFTDKEASLRELLAAAREGRSIALLQDTRVDSGVMIPLFGVEAATTISPAKIGRRFGYPLVPVQVVREPGQRFRLRFHTPLTPPHTDDEKAAALDLTRQYHRLLEGWIAARPGDWLCTKRRWPKTAAPPA